MDLIFSLESDGEDSLPVTPPALPADVLCQVFQHGTVRHWASWAQLSSEANAAVDLLRSSSRSLLATHTVHNIAPSVPSLRPALTPLQKLCTLRLPGSPDRSSHLVDDHLAILGEQLPSLEVLDLQGQPQLTNRGVRQLASGCLGQSLTELDLTYCPLLGYAVVLHMRSHCARLRLVRRLPRWMVGWATTPNGERHTYYADGSFQFSRDTESTGWVAQCRPSVDEPEDCWETRLVYVDDPEGLWGPQAHNGRVGVLVRRVHATGDASDERTAAAPAAAREKAADAATLDAATADTVTAHAGPVDVCIVQSLRVPEPPPAFPQLPETSLPACGATRTFRKVDGGVMCSRLRIIPLLPAEPSPPAELTAKLVAFCEQFATQRREFERRALKSMLAPRQTGDERMAAVLQRLNAALSPPSL